MNPHSIVDRPSGWVSRFAALIPQGEVLDLACGGGRHARLLAAMGHAVLAVDRDADALAKAAGERIATLRIDLESGSDERASWPFEANRFTGVVVTNYLHRPLFPHLAASLAPNGILIYETFAQGNGDFGKPSNPDFLLKPGELLEMARTNSACPLHVIAFEDGYIGQPKPAVVQRICAVKAGLGVPAGGPYPI
ncbi:MAG: methyltransferase protein [Herminiimonas sp.]|nr:methyltransferase protein [Herminiimonas sp.]